MQQALLSPADDKDDDPPHPPNAWEKRYDRTMSLFLQQRSGREPTLVRVLIVSYFALLWAHNIRLWVALFHGDVPRNEQFFLLINCLWNTSSTVTSQLFFYSLPPHWVRALVEHLLVLLRMVRRGRADVERWTAWILCSLLALSVANTAVSMDVHLSSEPSMAYPIANLMGLRIVEQIIAAPNNFFWLLPYVGVWQIMFALHACAKRLHQRVRNWTHIQSKDLHQLNTDHRAFVSQLTWVNDTLDTYLALASGVQIMAVIILLSRRLLQLGGPSVVSFGEMFWLLQNLGGIAPVIAFATSLHTHGERMRQRLAQLADLDVHDDDASAADINMVLTAMRERSTALRMGGTNITSDLLVKLGSLMFSLFFIVVNLQGGSTLLQNTTA